MSNNKQALELTDITTPLLAATQGFTMEDRDASTTTPIIDDLLDSAERGQNRRNQRPPSICKVPVSRIVRDDNKISYEPQLVSIGPIHREDPKLQEFEWLKECYLGDLLSRCDSTPKETLEACLLEVNDLIPKIRESYADVKNYSDDELARMMVMDGCFILEFCFKHDNEVDVYLQNKKQNIGKVSFTLRIAMDLILLENQVPFFVLEALFDCSMGKVSFTLSQVLDDYLAPYIKVFFSLLPEKNSTTNVHSDSTHDHVLGYMHNRYKLVASKSSMPKLAEASQLVDEEQAKASKKPPFFLNAPSPKKLCSSFCKIFRKCTWSNCVMTPSLHAEASKLVDAEALRGHTIVELDRSGMNFKPHQEDEWSMTIKFQSPRFPCLPWFGSKSTLLMPTLVIHDTTELILRNFIAYEQSLPEDRYHFTSYAHAMDKLIDTQEDIAKLVESKVLLNMLVSNKEAADMINKICKDMFVTDFYYTREFKQMNKYCNGFLPKNKRIYFSNPWNAYNLLVGIIVFLVTVVSGIFTVLQYFG